MTYLISSHHHYDEDKEEKWRITRRQRGGIKEINLDVVKKKKSTFVRSKPATRRWLLHYAFTCHRLTHVSRPMDRSSVSHIVDMWFEAVGCLVGTETAGGTPPSCLRLISAAHTHTDPLKDLNVGSASLPVMNPGPYGSTGCCVLPLSSGGETSHGGCHRWRWPWQGWFFCCCCLAACLWNIIKRKNTDMP